MVNFDAMKELENQTQLKHLEAEAAYIMREMVDPILGCTVVSGLVDSSDMDGMPMFANPFPTITFQRPDGTLIVMMVSADDECNEGGRLIQIV